MEIKRSGSQPSGSGPKEWFTGVVRVDPLHLAPEPARVTAASVTFEPRARSNWHTHPLGQTLIVTAGCGLVQSWGGPVRKIRPGDVIWCPPGEKHWHGGTATTAVTHIAVQEHLGGKNVEWLERVTDEEFGKGELDQLRQEAANGSGAAVEMDPREEELLAGAIKALLRP